MYPSRILLSFTIALAASGCSGARKPCTPATAPCSGTGAISHGGLERTYLFHLPPGVTDHDAHVGERLIGTTNRDIDATALSWEFFTTAGALP